MASFLLDAVLVGLLTATIIYAVILDRRLRTFRNAREEMQSLLAHFTAATIQAQSNMTSLREASQTTSVELNDQLNRGKALRDDLAFLVDRGTSLADRLEGGISAARGAAKTSDGPRGPAVRLAEAVNREAADTRAPGARKNDLRAGERPSESRGGESRSAPPADAARDFLRALKAAR
jgi:hypothetical protein